MLTMTAILRATIALSLTGWVLTTQMATSSEAAELECKNASKELRALHETLYHYAVLAEIPYGDARENTDTSPYDKSCKIQHTSKTLRPANPLAIIKTAKLSDELTQLFRAKGNKESDKRLSTMIDEYALDAGKRKRWTRQYVAIDDRSGTTYIGCRRDSRTPVLFVSWKELTVDNVPIMEDRLPVPRQATVIVPQIYVAVTRENGHSNTIQTGIGWEELGLVKLKPIDPVSNVHSVLAIRGTDFENLSTVITSVNDVLTESCAFESTAVIVKVIAGRIAGSKDTKRPRTKVIVTGHSLGGAATQYIGQSSIGPRTSAMQGYAFNAMGVDDSNPRNSEPSESLYSQYVHGDPVSMGGKLLGRIQPGTVLVSKPASSLPRWLRDLSISISRHKLDTVQKALCQCLNGEGWFVEQ